MRRIALFIATLALSSGAVAAPPTRESVDTLLAVTHTERVVQTMLDSMDRIFQGNVVAAVGGPLTDEQRKTMEAMQARTMQIFRQIMTWDRLQPMYEQVYADTYSQDEVDGLIAFYRTPVGTSYIDKQGLVLQKSIAASQVLLKPMMEQLKAATSETVAALRSAETTTTR